MARTPTASTCASLSDCNAGQQDCDSLLVQMDEAKRLREKWAEKGSPPCDHPVLIKEYYLGAQTMDKICNMCGEEFTPADLLARKAEGR
jgi:hypothetical protein